MEKLEKIKLSKWLENNIPHYFPNKSEIINIIQLIADATIPIRGLLEKGITSRELHNRMNIEEPVEKTKNIYDEEQIHEDILTHSIILKTLQESGQNFAFIASEEAEPVLGEGKFGITIDPVDGSSNVAVNRTVGTIVGVYDQKEIICAFYILYGIFTNMVIAINGKVAEFILDTVPYSLTFYHYVFLEFKTMPDLEEGGIRCLGGDSTKWSKKCKDFEMLLIKHHFKDRYSGSFVGDFHAILNYGGIYAYFPSPQGKLRLYYEWIPLAFIAKTLGGEFLVIDDKDNIKYMKDVDSLTKDNVKRIHATVCGGLIGTKKIIDLFKNY
ncbi:MAG: hypothetical protein ACTSQJ_13700 [Promethearchaeota archaeon]